MNPKKWLRMKQSCLLGEKKSLTISHTQHKALIIPSPSQPKGKEWGHEKWSSTPEARNK